LAATGEEAPLAPLSGRAIAAFCGLGNPAGFRRTLESCGLKVAAWREFPDHHVYTPTDCRSLADWVSGQPEIGAVVCTHKDLVKVSAADIGGKPLWALSIELAILSGREELEQRCGTLADRTVLR
jgi:tetraacyldisaccharide 4'-kinase